MKRVQVNPNLGTVGSTIVSSRNDAYVSTPNVSPNNQAEQNMLLNVLGDWENKAKQKAQKNKLEFNQNQGIEGKQAYLQGEEFSADWSDSKRQAYEVLDAHNKLNATLKDLNNIRESDPEIQSMNPQEFGEYTQDYINQTGLLENYSNPKIKEGLLNSVIKAKDGLVDKHNQQILSKETEAKFNAFDTAINDVVSSDSFTPEAIEQVFKVGAASGLDKPVMIQQLVDKAVVEMGDPENPQDNLWQWLESTGLSNSPKYAKDLDVARRKFLSTTEDQQKEAEAGQRLDSFVYLNDRANQGVFDEESARKAFDNKWITDNEFVGLKNKASKAREDAEKKRLSAIKEREDEAKMYQGFGGSMPLKQQQKLLNKGITKAREEGNTEREQLMLHVGASQGLMYDDDKARITNANPDFPETFQQSFETYQKYKSNYPSLLYKEISPAKIVQLEAYEKTLQYGTEAEALQAARTAINPDANKRKQAVSKSDYDELDSHMTDTSFFGEDSVGSKLEDLEGYRFAVRNNYEQNRMLGLSHEQSKELAVKQAESSHTVLNGVAIPNKAVGATEEQLLGGWDKTSTQITEALSNSSSVQDRSFVDPEGYTPIPLPDTDRTGFVGVRRKSDGRPILSVGGDPLLVSLEHSTSGYINGLQTDAKDALIEAQEENQKEAIKNKDSRGKKPKIPEIRTDYGEDY